MSVDIAMRARSRRHEHCLDLLTRGAVRHTNHNGLGHCWKLFQYRLNLYGIDLVAGDIDESARAPAENQVPAGVDAA